MKSKKSMSKLYRRCSACKKRRRAEAKDGIKWQYSDGQGICPICVLNKFVAFI